jgi:hypothetical protein
MHWRHLALFCVLGRLALATAPTAFAGGWAVTTLDELPATLNAGETYAVGYTIRQHGQTPLVTSQSAIEIRDAKGGGLQRFPGKADGAQGHYVAQVRFPSAGEWQWSADQSPFQPQALGGITIVAAAPVPVLQPVTAPAPAVVNVPIAAPEPTAAPVAVGSAAEPAPVQALEQTPPTGVESTSVSPLRIALPVATLLALLVFAWRLLVYLRPRESAATAH